MATAPATPTRVGAAFTSLQQGMIFNSLSEPSAGVDIEHITFELNEAVDIDRLVASWQTVSEANPILLTAVDLTGQQPRPRLEPDASIPAEVHDWTDLNDADQADNWSQIAASDRRTGFDLTVAPLQRLVFAQLGPNRWRGLWSFHHLILDGRSFPLVLRDVFARYDHGTTPTARPPLTEFIDAVADVDETAHQQFWKSELAGLEPLPPLQILSDDERRKLDQPQPDSGAIENQFVVERRLDQATTRQITAAAAQLGVSVNSLVQTAWAIMLSRYLGTNDIVFASTRACRHVVDGADEMVGLLINTVPFRVVLDPDATVESATKMVADTHRRLRTAETSPLHLIRQWVGIDPSVDLLNTLVMFDDASLGRRVADLGAQRSFDYAGQTNFAVTLLAYADPEMLIRLETRPDTIGLEPTHRIAGQFIEVLTTIATDPSQLVRAVGCLTDSDRALLASFNDTDVDYNLDQTLVDLLRDQARRTPEAPAVSFGDETLTYRQFRERVEHTASWLVGNGVGIESVVAVYANRSIEMMVAIHGIVEAGAAYLPLDPDYPTDRLRFMVEDASVHLILSAAATDADRLAGATDVVTVADVLADQTHDEAAPVPASSAATPSSAAYVIYTSGSTGRPKGVTNEHRGIVNRLLWMQDAFELDSSDVVLQKTPITFDVSVWELFWPLIVGAQLHVAPPDAHREPRRLVEQIVSSGTTTMHFVPSMLALFVEEPTIARCTSLRRVICSGEALGRDLQDRTLANLDVALHNLYGPTEAAIDVTWWQCDPDSPLTYVPIGAAIANTRMHVLDPNLQPVPPGAAGELFIAGVQVARGYLNRPELNTEKFLEADAHDLDEGRMYRTGDLGRHREDGSIEYLGRTDHQVKIRGLRIELGEIESSLMSHPAVANAAVAVREDRPGDQQLVGYVTLGDDRPDDLEESLGAHLAVSLTDFMVPRHFVVLDEFPLTTSGKIDRKLLPAPTLAPSVAELPLGEVERQIASIWCDLLELDEIDRTVSFFRAGGHSLLVVRLANALGEQFGTEVEVTALIDNATVASQAALFTHPNDAEPSDRLKAAADAASSRRAAAQRRTAAGRRRRVGTNDRNRHDR